MIACDTCNKEIVEPEGGYTISIKHNNFTTRYDGCSVECCAKIFRNLADKWNNDSCNQG